MGRVSLRHVLVSRQPHAADASARRHLRRRGLQRARELFGNRPDLDIEQGLRARYQAGFFRIKDLRQQHDAYAILIFAGGSAFRPCRRANAAG